MTKMVGDVYIFGAGLYIREDLIYPERMNIFRLSLIPKGADSGVLVCCLLTRNVEIEGVERVYIGV